MELQSVTPVREMRIVVLGAISIFHGVAIGSLFTICTAIYLSRGIHGNLYDVGTSITALLTGVSPLSIPLGMGLLYQHQWAVTGSFGVAVGLLVLSGLGFVLNLMLDPRWCPFR